MTIIVRILYVSWFKTNEITILSDPVHAFLVYSLKCFYSSV